MKTHDIFTDTILIPELIASTLTSDPKEEQWLAERANRHFRELPKFRKKLKSDDGRDFLHDFMAHWLAGLRLAIANGRTAHLAAIGWTTA